MPANSFSLMLPIAAVPCRLGGPVASMKATGLLSRRVSPELRLQFDNAFELTGEDDANVLACLYAKSVSVQSKKNKTDADIETIAVVHRLKLLDLLETNQVDAALSPRTATANSVLRFVRGDVGSVAAVETFLHGDVEVLEFAVSDESPCVGKTIEDMALTKDALIGAIVRDGKAQIARGHSTFRPNDHVIAISKPESVEKLTTQFV